MMNFINASSNVFFCAQIEESKIVIHSSGPTGGVENRRRSTSLGTLFTLTNEKTGLITISAQI